MFHRLAFVRGFWNHGEQRPDLVEARHHGGYRPEGFAKPGDGGLERYVNGVNHEKIADRNRTAFAGRDREQQNRAGQVG
ncbi:MAG: hypothetical protein F4Z61_06165 [Acidimicrobiia bacterium]|nr:hypothetical protein [Acidimicrobiia bacterium]